MSTTYNAVAAEFDGAITVPQDGVDDLVVDTVNVPIKEMADGLLYVNNRIVANDPGRDASYGLLEFDQNLSLAYLTGADWSVSYVIYQTTVSTGLFASVNVVPHAPISTTVKIKNFTVTAKAAPSHVGTTFTPVRYSVFKASAGATTTLIAEADDPTFSLGLGSYEAQHTINFDLSPYSLNINNKENVVLNIRGEFGAEALVGYEVRNLRVGYGV